VVAGSEPGQLLVQLGLEFGSTTVIHSLFHRPDLDATRPAAYFHFRISSLTFIMAGVVSWAAPLSRQCLSWSTRGPGRRVGMDRVGRGVETMREASVGQLAGRLTLETIVRSPLVVIADPVVAASGPPPTIDDLAGGAAAVLDRPAGRVLALANPGPGSGLFVWVTSTGLAVVADPEADAALAQVGELTVSSGRLVVGAPEVVAAWGADVDTGDGSVARARVHRGRTRLGLIVVTQSPSGTASVCAGGGVVTVSFPSQGADGRPVPLPLAG